MGSRSPADGSARPSTPTGADGTAGAHSRALEPGPAGSRPARTPAGLARGGASSSAVTASPSWHCIRSTAAGSGMRRRWDWCLELRLATAERQRGRPRTAVCAEFLGDLRLLGMQPGRARVEPRRRALMALAIMIFAAALGVIVSERVHRTKVALLGAVRSCSRRRSTSSGDRGDRLEHARPARRDDADRQAHRADRRLHVARDPGRSALAGAAAAVVVSLAAHDRAAVGVPGQPDDGAADGADHLPARRRAGHRPDPAGRDRDPGLQHRRHGDADRRSAEHHHRRRHRPVIRGLHRQPCAGRVRHLRRGDGRSLPGLPAAAAGRARGPRAGDGARRTPLDRGHRRAQAHGPGAGRHDPAVLRPPGRSTSSRPRSP